MAAFLHNRYISNLIFLKRNSKVKIKQRFKFDKPHSYVQELQWKTLLNKQTLHNLFFVP